VAHPRGLGGGGYQAASPQIEIWKKKKTDFVDSDIKWTWFTLHPKSATEIGWWLEHLNFEK
jgi:hypothetical protein